MADIPALTPYSHAMHYLDQEHNFLGIEDTFSNLQDSHVCILPIPYERTTSYVKGTARAPSKIIHASQHVELYDEEINDEPYKVGIATLPELDFTQFENSHGGGASGRNGAILEAASQEMNFIYESVSQLLDKEKFVVSVGGEHSISSAIVRAFTERFDRLSVLQLDAHSDLRDCYEGSKHSHASVMRRIYEITPNIVQVGIRSQCLEERDFIAKNKIPAAYAYDIIDAHWAGPVIKTLEDNVYITIDCDFFDPALIPAVGTPEPGGFGWYETLDFLQAVPRAVNVVGFDVVELSPIEGLAHPDFTIAKLIYKLIGYVFS